MGISKTFKVVDIKGNPVQLPSGRYFCFNCLKMRKLIPYPCVDTIEPCSCGSTIVFVQ